MALNLEDVLKRRFIHTTESVWSKVSESDKTKFDDKIVFIKSDNEDGVGRAIYTQGHTFNTDDVTAANLLAKLKAGENVTIAEEVVDGVKTGKLLISATDTTYTLTVAANAETDATGAKLTFTSSNDETDATNIEIVGEGNTKVEYKDGKIVISSDETEYVAGDNAIYITPGTGNNLGKQEVELNVSKSDKMLTIENDGLKANLSIRYNSEAVSGEAEGFGKANHIELLGKDGKAFASFDASDFVKDSFLKNAEFVTLKDGDVEGQAAGEYIKFTFVTVDTDGEPTTEVTSAEQTFYVPVTTFVKKGTISYTPAQGETAHSLTATTTNGTLADVTEVVDAITKYTAGAIAELDSTVTAEATVDGKDAEGQPVKVTPENTVDVITSITQSDGKLASVVSANVAKTEYVDNKLSDAAGKIEYKDVTVGEGESAVTKKQFTETKDGYVTTDDATTALNILENRLDAVEIKNTGVASVAGDTDDSGFVTIAAAEADKDGKVQLTVTTSVVDGEDTDDEGNSTATGLATDLYVQEQIAAAIAEAFTWGELKDTNA